MNRSLWVTGDVSSHGKVTSLPELPPMSLDSNVTRGPIALDGSVTHVSGSVRQVTDVR